MKDFGDQERLLKSNERKALWGLYITLSEEQLAAIDSPYTYQLSLQKAKQDNAI